MQNKIAIIISNLPASDDSEIILNTPNRNEILKEGPPQNSYCNILGRGAYGTVFKAVFEAKQVAVKIVKNATDVNLQSVRNEAHVLGWKHRNIVRILKVESTPNFGIVIMERFAGQCLQLVLDTVELPLAHRVFVSLDILSALDFCHRRHVLHLDVKPQNILVSFTGAQSQFLQKAPLMRRSRCYICKLCDFGSSMKLGKREPYVTRGVAKGTVRYMSSEALREEPLTPAADIYSLGITMWQLQHRRLPYYWIESNEVVAYQVVKNNLRPDSDLGLFGTLNLQRTKARHRHCLCEHFSSEASYRSLEHIKNLLNHTQALSFKDSVADSWLHKPQDLLRGEVVRVPFAKLNLQAIANVPRDLRSELGLKSGSQNLQHRSPGDGWLESVFRQPAGAHNISAQRNFDALYKSCWQSNCKRRPSAEELRRKLEKLL